MPKTPDQMTYGVLACGVTLLGVSYALLWLLRTLRKTRPDLAIGTPVLTAFALRVIAAAVVSLTSIGSALRGGDEFVFVSQAHQVSQTPFGSGEWTHALAHSLYIFVMSVQVWLWNAPDFALRVTQAGLAVAGLALVATAAHELAGRRAGLIAAWVLALEPTNMFFSSLLHKEPLMMFATGLVVFGATLVWKRGDLRFLSLVGIGCLIAIATRGYAGWFLIAAGGAVTLHAGLRSEHRGSARSVSLIALVVILITVTAPTVVSTTSGNLQHLQNSQSANANNQQANLRLEQVNVSTPGAALASLPRKLFDMTFRPFPWQLGSIGQQVGLVGTAIAYTTLLFLVWLLVQCRGRIMEFGAPFVYTLGFLYVAYSLSSGNAGTAFRYRTHLVMLAIVLAAVLWEARRAEAKEPSHRLRRAPPRRAAVPAGAR